MEIVWRNIKASQVFCLSELKNGDSLENIKDSRISSLSKLKNGHSLENIKDSQRSIHHHTAIPQARSLDRRCLLVRGTICFYWNGEPSCWFWACWWRYGYFFGCCGVPDTPPLQTIPSWGIAHQVLIGQVLVPLAPAVYLFPTLLPLCSWRICTEAGVCKEFVKLCVKLCGVEAGACFCSSKEQLRGTEPRVRIDCAMRKGESLGPSSIEIDWGDVSSPYVRRGEEVTSWELPTNFEPKKKELQRPPLAIVRQEVWICPRMGHCRSGWNWGEDMMGCANWELGRRYDGVCELRIGAKI